MKAFCPANIYLARRSLALLCLALTTTGQAQSYFDTKKLVAGNNAFAFNLLRAVVKEQPDQNVFISPYSVATALQMIGNGAAGGTRDEIMAALGVPTLAQSNRNAAAKELSAALRKSAGDVTWSSANAIWYRKSYVIKPEFTRLNRSYFDAMVAGVDFDSSATVKMINDWANKQTHGKIPSIVSGPLDPRLRMLLANAVYFKGQWLSTFEEKDTQPRAFKVRTGAPKQTPLMFKQQHWEYRRGTGYQSVRMPYRGDELAMYVFLPDASSSPEKLLAIMNGDNWERVTVPGFARKDGKLMLPRFKCETSVDLKPPLRSLGIKSAFLESANFSALSDEPVFISEAQQKAFVEANEQGTEAAAVTEFYTLSAGIAVEKPKPFEMVVDRPFLFLIVDRGTSSILFMGLIVDPNT